MKLTETLQSSCALGTVWVYFRYSRGRPDERLFKARKIAGFFYWLSCCLRRLRANLNPACATSCSAGFPFFNVSFSLDKGFPETNPMQWRSG